MVEEGIITGLIKKNKRVNVVSRNSTKHNLTIFKKILRYVLKIWNLT